MKYSNITLNWDYNSDVIDTFVIYRSEDESNIIHPDNKISEIDGKLTKFSDDKIYADTQYYYVIGAILGDRIKYSNPIGIMSGMNNGLVEWEIDNLNIYSNLIHDMVDIDVNRTIWTDGVLKFEIQKPLVYDDSIVLNNDIFKTLCDIKSHQIWGVFVFDVISAPNAYSTPYVANQNNAIWGMLIQSRPPVETFVGWNIQSYDYFKVHTKIGKQISFWYIDKNTGYMMSYMIIGGIVYHNKRSLQTNNVNILKPLVDISLGVDVEKMKVYQLIIGEGALDTTTIDRIIGKVSWEHNFQDILPVNHPYKTFKPLHTLDNLDTKNSEILRFKKWEYELNSLSGVYDRIGGALVAYPNDCHSGAYACSKWSFNQNDNIITATLDGYNTGVGGNSYYNVANNPISVINLKFDDVVKNIDLVNADIDIPDESLWWKPDNLNVFLEYNPSTFNPDNNTWHSTDNKPVNTLKQMNSVGVSFENDTISIRGNNMSAVNIHESFSDYNGDLWAICLYKNQGNPSNCSGIASLDINGNRFSMYWQDSVQNQPELWSFLGGSQSGFKSYKTYDQFKWNVFTWFSSSTTGYRGMYITNDKNVDKYSTGVNTYPFNLGEFNLYLCSQRGEYIGSADYKVLIYGYGVITDDIVRKLEGYVCHKYNTLDALPNDHPYKHIPPLKD